MDPISQTLMTLVLMAAAVYVGKRVGRQEGISAAVSYLVEMGACNNEDIREANEKFMEGDDF